MKLDYIVTGVITVLMVCTVILLLVIKSPHSNTGFEPTITKDGQTLYLVKSFHYVEPGENTCMAISPECGVCPGEVVNKLCYAEKNY
jgi:hypothetical protein